MILYIYNGLKNEFYFNKRDEKRNLRIVKRMSPEKTVKFIPGQQFQSSTEEELIFTGTR